MSSLLQKGSTRRTHGRTPRLTSIILLKCRLKVLRGGSTLIETFNEKRKKLNPLFYVKDFGWLRLNLLKLIIYSSHVLL
jgi:hypothetical protein